MLIFIGLFLRPKGPFINFNLLTKNVQLVEEITCFLKKCIKSNLNDKEFFVNYKNFDPEIKLLSAGLKKCL